MKRLVLSALLLAGAVVGFGACGGGAGTAGADGGGADGGADGGGGFVLDIVVAGDASPKAFTDGYAGQTPSVYTLGLQRFDLMTGPSDPSPVVVFDRGAAYAEVDLLTSQTVASVPQRSIAPGTYGYGRILLTMARFAVEATVHVTVPTPAALPGTLHVVTSLTDGTLIDGTARDQGWAEYTFSGAPGVTYPGTVPALPSTGGGTIDTANGQTWMIFPIVPAIEILAEPERHRVATITYDTFESFRWEDQGTTGYATGVFDVDGVSGTWEPVRNFGATGYHVTVD